MTIKKAQDLKPGDTLERWNGPAVVESVTIHPPDAEIAPNGFVQVKTDASPMSNARAFDSDVKVQ